MNNNMLKNIGVFLMLMIYVSLCFFSQMSESVTVDEFAHFPSGIYNLKTLDWRMDSAAPPLVKCFPALSAIFTHPKMETELFHESPNTWSLGYSFMYLNQDRYKSIFTYGRCMTILLGLLLGILIYRWGREIYGYKGALFALLLYAFNPNILAHSSLTTIDIGASCMIFLSVYCLWKYLKIQNTSSIIMAGITLGLAQLSKFTAILIYPVFFLILMSLCITGAYKIKEERLNILKINFIKYSKEFLIIILISIFIINLGYLFSNSFKPLHEYNFSSSFFNNFFSLIWSGFPVPLPYDYLTGLDSQLAQAAGGHPFYVSYLMGEHSLSGWWHYYIIAFLVKNPVSLPIILLLAVIVWLKIRTGKIDIITSLCIWLPAISYFIYFSFFTHTPIGIRYLLPVFPFLFLASGYLFSESITKFKSMKYILAFLTISYVSSAFLAFPHYLSYFNIASGGSEKGYRWLIESNLDWGQDLPGLKKYLDKNNIKEIKLGYFGRVDPGIYGISYSLAEKEPKEGIYAISINYLVGRPYYILDNRLKELKDVDLNYFNAYRRLAPVAIVGNTIYIFVVKKIANDVANAK